MAAVLTNAGKAAIASRICGAGAEAVFDYLATGTGTTAAAAADTTLETEITDSGLARAQDASPTRETTTVTNDTAVVSVTFSVTGTKAVTEGGLLNAASGGTLMVHDVHAVINLANGHTYIYTVKVQAT